ncbi:MAG: GxxExxY protein [Candidatus Cloacimonetes bacterium]|nr:GxxExxY protein [Candidatus Cloacimonadota bacterium]
MDENQLSNIIIGAAIEVHQTLGGPGLLECVYEEALLWELLQNNLIVQRQKVIPIQYKDIKLGNPLKIDLIVNDLIIVECKACVSMHEAFEAQLLTYLRLTGLKLGLLINFGEKLVSQGIRRVVNGL